jgi:hypothetical protein
VCPNTRVRYVIWIRPDENSPWNLLPKHPLEHVVLDEAIDRAELYLASQKSPCLVAIYQYHWDQHRGRSIVRVVWEDDNAN